MRYFVMRLVFGLPSLLVCLVARSWFDICDAGGSCHPVHRAVPGAVHPGEVGKQIRLNWLWMNLVMLTNTLPRF